MNLGTYDINIDFSKLFIHNNTSIYFKEGDLNTAKVRARLTMKNKPINIAGCNVTIRIEPTEGNTITDNATVIDPINGIIEIDFKSNALLEGTHLFEVWIIKDESIKKSGKIGYRVLDSIEDAGSIEGTNEYPILISLISDTNKAIQDAKEVLNIAKDMESNVNEAIGNTNVAISNAETATSNANSKITELDDAKTSMVEKVDTSIDTMKSDVNKAKEDMKLTTDAKVKEIDTAITNMNSSVEDAKASMQATTDAKMQQVDNSIVAMKSDVETAKNEMVSKTDEKIADVDRALAAGTVDLELKASRDGEESLPARLKRDLYIDEVPVKQRVLNLENMKEMQDLEYSTDKGYAICEQTGNGTVKDLKIYGKSLANRFIYASNGDDTDTVKQIICKDYKNLNSGKFTIPNISNKPLRFNIYNKNNDSYIRTQTVNPGSSVVVDLDKENAYLYDVNGAVSDGWTSCYELKAIAMFIQGEHFNLALNGHFEGIASVGNGNEIEVSSVKSYGNMIPPKYVIGGVNANTGEDYNQTTQYVRSDYFTLVKGKYYVKELESNPKFLYLYNLNGDYIGKKTISSQKYVDIDSSYNARIDINLLRVATEDDLNSVKVVLSMSESPSLDHKQYKKTPLYKDTDGLWKPILNARGIDERNCDVIDTTKNIFEVKYEEVVMNGNPSENWVKKSEVQSSTKTQFVLANYTDKLQNETVVLCDKLPWEHSFADKEHVWVNGSGINIVLDNTKASTVEQLKTYLQINNITCVVKNKVSKTYEINPIYPEAFEDETLMLFKTGPISPRATWKITSNLVGVLGNVKDRVKRMENDFYKYTVTQNRLQLGTTYSSDRTTFRVDTATFTTEKAKQDLDYDLFRLLRHNILVGPQNYDKAEMENMMDFYVSVGKIDYNMWDELYMLIEEQHNPPVEEEAPVI